MSPTLPTLAALLLAALLLVALLVQLLRLRRERATLHQELRRVRRAGAGKAEAQGIELDWHRALAHALPQPLLVTGSERELLFANPAARALFGTPEPREAAIKRLRHHLLEEQIVRALHEEQADPQIVELPNEQFYLARAGSWPHDQPPHGAFLLLEDVTEQRRLARARRDMAANLSHELRTPLTSLKLLVETLEEGAIEEPALARRFVGRIAVETEGLIRLVEDLTALSWIESGRTPLRLERCLLRELVAQRVARLAPLATQRDVHLVIEGDAPRPLSLDPDRFGQVLNNLLDNAISFSPRGGTVTIRLEQEDAQSRLLLHDEGPGILPADLPRIFERFYKGDRMRTRSGAGGTGLGLAIVKHLVEAHGATIRAQSRFGQGATFIITLAND